MHSQHFLAMFFVTGHISRAYWGLPSSTYSARETGELPILCSMGASQGRLDVRVRPPKDREATPSSPACTSCLCVSEPRGRDVALVLAAMTAGRYHKSCNSCLVRKTLQIATWAPDMIVVHRLVLGYAHRDGTLRRAAEHSRPDCHVRAHGVLASLKQAWSGLLFRREDGRDPSTMPRPCTLGGIVIVSCP